MDISHNFSTPFHIYLFFTINILHEIVLCMVYFFQLLLKQNCLIRNSPTQCNLFWSLSNIFFTVMECNTIYFLLFSIRFFVHTEWDSKCRNKYKYYLENYELWQKISTLYMYMHVNIACLFILDIFSCFYHDIYDFYNILGFYMYVYKRFRYMCMHIQF